MALDEVSFKWESRRWLELDDALALSQQMLALLRTISELPTSEYQVRLGGPAASVRRGAELADLRKELAGADAGEVEQYDYLVSQPALPKLSARLRMRRWPAQGTVLVVRGTHRKTVQEMGGALARLLENRLGRP